MELRHVKTGELDLSLGRLRQIPAGAVKAMLASLRSKGQLSPVVAASQDGALVLIDGFVRQLAAARLGFEALLVEVVEVSPVQMKAQVYLRNRDRAMALFEECRLVFELCELDGLNQVEIGELLERHKSWVCRRLALYHDLSPQLLEEHALGLLGAGSVRRLARLSPRNQERLVAVGRQHELSAREMSLLVDLWQRTPDPDSRGYLLAHPKEALERILRRPEPPADPRLGEAARRLLLGLQSLAEISLRLERHLREGLGELSPEGLELLGKAWQRAEELTSTALSALGGWLKSKGGSGR